MRRLLRLVAVVLGVLGAFWLLVLAFGRFGALPLGADAERRTAYTGTVVGVLAGIVGSVLILLLDREREAADLAEFEARWQHPGGRVLLRVGVCLTVAGVGAAVVAEYAWRRLGVPSPIWREYAAYGLIAVGVFAVVSLLLAVRGRLWSVPRTPDAGGDRATRLRRAGLAAALLLPAATVAGAGVVTHLSYLDHRPDPCLAGRWTVASRIGTFPGGGKNPPVLYTGGGGEMRFGTDGKGHFTSGAESQTYRASQGDNSFELRSEVWVAFTYRSVDGHSISFDPGPASGREGRGGAERPVDPATSTVYGFTIGYDYVCFPDKLIFERGPDRIEFTRGDDV